RVLTLFLILPAILLDVDAGDLFGVLERDLLQLRVDRRARPGEDRHLEAELARVDPRLDDAGLGRAAREQQPLDLELAQQQLERRVVERRVARLEQERLTGPRREFRDHVAAVAAERLLEQAAGVAVPAAVVVVDVDDRRLLFTRARESLAHRRQPLPEGDEQLAAVVVLEVGDHVDDEERVVHALRYARRRSAFNPPRSDASSSSTGWRAGSGRRARRSAAETWSRQPG